LIRSIKPKHTLITHIDNRHWYPIAQREITFDFKNETKRATAYIVFVKFANRVRVEIANWKVCR